MPKYIFNTTALSNFASVGKIDLLENRFSGLSSTTIEVINELRKGIYAGYYYLESALNIIENYGNNGWIQIVYPYSYSENKLSDSGDILPNSELSKVSSELSEIISPVPFFPSPVPFFPLK